MVAVATCVPSPNGGAPNKSRLTVCEGCEGVYVGGCVGVEDQLSPNPLVCSKESILY